jgi:hemerythrin-like metal-binding protein
MTDDASRDHGATRMAATAGGLLSDTGPALVLPAAVALWLPRLDALPPSDPRDVLLALEIDRHALIVHLHGAEAAEVIERHLLTALEERSPEAWRSLVRTGPGQCAVLAPGPLEAGETLARTAAEQFGRRSWSGLGETTVSAAVARRFPGEPAESWWSRVESALAQAKAGGGGQVVVDRRSTAEDGSVGAPGLHLQWQARFECGEPTIDRQHRELFARAEDVLEALRRGSARFATDLERLMDEIARHFADEELILKQRGYRGLSRHRRSHAMLSAKAMRLKADAVAGRASREELTRFLLGEVVADHMLTEDRRFAELFASAHRR